MISLWKRILKIALFIVLFLSINSILFTRIIISYPEIDHTDYVTKIFDGDTFQISNGEVIRLADIDTPETGEEGYLEASEFLEKLIYNREVFLDIDDVNYYDTLGKRVVCVAYISANETHYLNVNKALLDTKLADIWDHYNEFNPSLWHRFIEKPTIELMIETLMKTTVISLIIAGITYFTLSKISSSFSNYVSRIYNRVRNPS